MKHTISVSQRGQITLPVEVRRSLRITEGGVVTLELRNGEVVIRPAAITEIEVYSDEDIALWDKEDRLDAEGRKRIQRKLSR
jgi:AbrB family looped-hinge helix DNA binding protein